MIATLFWFLPAFAVGVGFLFIASNKRARMWMMRNGGGNGTWGYIKTHWHEETIEAYSITVPLMIGVLIVSGTLALFLIWLLS
jgi:hypothetical protein